MVNVSMHIITENDRAHNYLNPPTEVFPRTCIGYQLLYGWETDDKLLGYKYKMLKGA